MSDHSSTPEEQLPVILSLTETQRQLLEQESTSRGRSTYEEALYAESAKHQPDNVRSWGPDRPGTDLEWENIRLHGDILAVC